MECQRVINLSMQTKRKISMTHKIVTTIKEIKYMKKSLECFKEAILKIRVNLECMDLKDVCPRIRYF